MVRPQPRRPLARPHGRLTGLSACLSTPALLLALMAAPAQAGSVTAESIWDKSNAVQRAQSQVPAGATVTRRECTVVNVRTGNDRYICTVFYADPPAPASTSAPSAPAP
jgi:hypothetical protein